MGTLRICEKDGVKGGLMMGCTLWILFPFFEITSSLRTRPENREKYAKNIPHITNVFGYLFSPCSPNVNST